MKKVVTSVSNAIYIAGCVVLYMIALCILVSSVWSMIQEIGSADYTVYKLLDEVGLIVFSIAVIDVGKYLMVEEVLRGDVKRGRPGESRKALTKFAMIIASALSLEGLVLTIEVAKEDITKIGYPVSVLVTAILYIVGLALYRRLSSGSNK
ncbi:MAG: hypothetical protein OXF02_08140 [Simkaniaceae bacterium]|nr:hypothetical protein [Simkaniaceae bacterium]